MKEYEKLALNHISSADKTAMDEAKKVWKSVCKPLGSLGQLEEAVIRLAGIFQTPEVVLEKRCAIIVCADNGVVAEGITQSDSDVTTAVAYAIAEGRSNINTMANAVNADVFAVDVGMKDTVEHPGIWQYKIAQGTENIAKGAAMTREQALAGIQTGIDLVKEAKTRGYQLVVTGEMGIGNTTTSSAIASVLLNQPPEAVTGKGAGLSAEGLIRKVHAIERAIAVNKPDPGDPVGLIHKLGGYDIAAMTGMFLGGAIYRIPVVIDGLISSISALLAQKMAPDCRDYMLASHMTEEPAGSPIMERLHLTPMIHAGMRLGEGTGGICLLPLLDIALAEYHQAHRFGQSGIAQYEEL